MTPSMTYCHVAMLSSTLSSTLTSPCIFVAILPSGPGLPVGATRRVAQGYEEITIPAAKKMSKAGEEELVSVAALDNWAQLAFEGTKRLNRIQSMVYETAYLSCENMLVCAPTGAGKTNIAMLAFLQHVKQHINEEGMLDLGAVKAVYIAPMKALAQEIVAKFSERLAPLRMQVLKGMDTLC